MTSPLLQQLGAFCTQHPWARKYVFVPSRQVGYNLGNALALAGCNWVNLELVTPVDHALARVGPTLVAQSIRPISDDVQLLLVERVLDEVLAESPGSYFADVPRSGGLARAFRTTLRSLRLSGVRPDDVAGRLTSPKGRFVAAAFRRYVERLNEAKYYDDGLVLERALESAGANGPEGAVYGILDETPVPGLAGQYVEAVARGRLFRLGVSGIEIAHPPQAAARRFPTAPPVQPVDSPIGALTLHTCIGSENEVRETLRMVLDAGVPFDAVEIAYTSERPYLSRLVDLADRFDVPIAYGAGMPAMLTRSGQAVVGFLRWIAGGYAARELVALARGGHLDPILPRDGERALRGYELARQIRLARIGRGRDQYLTQLRRRASGMAAPDHGVLALSVRAMEALLEIALPGTTDSVSAVSLAASAFLDRFARISTERDRIAIDSLQDRLKKLREVPPADGQDASAAARVVEFLKEHKIEASAARPGAVYAVPVSRAGYSHRPCLFIVGLDEASFPGSPVEDPVLLDDERTLLSPAVTLLRTGPAEQVWQMERALRSGARQVTLIAQRHALHESREVYPSAFFQRLAEQHPPEHLPLVAPLAGALDCTESFLARLPGSSVRTQLETAYPALASGYRCLAARSDGGFTNHHGWIGLSLPPELLPGVVEPTSASRLEMLAACPYRFFLRDVLKVRPPDDPPDDPSIWLSPAEFGSVLHEVFRRFMTALGERGERPVLDLHANLLYQILERAVEEKLEEVPVHNEAAYKADVVRLRRAAGVFLADEARREAEAFAFEFSFGEGRSDGMNVPDPVVLRLSESLSIRLRGRIDRIDRRGDEYEIWDYKTGSPNPFDEHDLLGDGKHLQWALYGHVLDEILARRDEPGRTGRSGYFFVGDRGHGLRYGDVPPTAGHLGALLEPLLDMAREGAFLHVQKEKSCRYCDFAGICDGEAVASRSLAKEARADPERIPLEVPFRDALLNWIGGAG